MSLLSRTLSALAWTTGAKIIQQVFQFGLSVVLMRLLGPEAFGLLGMVLVFSGFANIFAELGFGSALVQRQELREEHRSTVFWLTLMSGTLLMLVFVAAAPAVASFYKQPLLKPMTVWMSLIFVFNAPGAVSRALLQKAMRFDTLAKVDVAALIISGGVATGVAVFGGGVWSLVIQQITSAGITTLLLLWLGEWRPRFMWAPETLRALFGYGAGLTGFNIINYWARSADKLLIGSFIGPVALGLYSRAYSLMLLPLSQIISVLGPVMFPTLSTIQGDAPRTRRLFLRVSSVLSFLTFPMMLGLVVVARAFVLSFFGAKWAGVIPVVQILAFVGITQTICNPTGWIYASQGRTDWMFWWGVGGSGALILSIIIGIFVGGIQSVAMAYLIGNLVITIPCIGIPGKLIGMSVKDVWQAVRGNLLCGVLMAVFVWAIGVAIPEGWPAAIRLLLQVSAGVVSYLGLVVFTSQEVLGELAQIRSNLPGLSKTAKSSREEAGEVRTGIHGSGVRETKMTNENSIAPELR